MDITAIAFMFIVALVSSMSRNHVLVANSQFIAVNGSIDEEYIANISQTLVHVYDYDFPNEETNFVVSTYVSFNDTSNRILFYTNYPNYSESWTLPHSNPLFPQDIAVTHSRFFCQDMANQSTSALDFSVRIQSFSSQPLEYSLKVESMHSNILQLNKGSTVSVPSCFPKYFVHTIPDNVQNVEVQLSSPSELCNLVRITSYSCPPDFSLRSTKGAHGFELTMLRSANLKVKRSDFIEGRMMILLIPVPAAQCGTKLDYGEKNNSKNITVLVKPSNTEFWSPILKMMVIFLIPYIMFAVIIGFEMILNCFFQHHSEKFVIFCKIKRRNPDSAVKSKTEIEETKDSGEGPEQENIDSEETKEADEKEDIAEMEIKDVKEDLIEKTEQTNVDEKTEKTEKTEKKIEKEEPEDIIHSPNALKKDEDLFEAFRTGISNDNLSEHVRIQYYNKILNDREANVSDVNLMGQRRLNRIAGLYILLVLIVGLFYMLPAVQVSFINRNQMTSTGVQDICYINFECDQELGPFRAFNNIWSNISYILLSILFSIITLFKNRTYVLHVKAEGHPVTGIPQRFGLYYAMSLALFFEGIMSAVYHICPSLINYQFDTTFMYILLTLLSIRLYKMRHPDMHIYPQSVFLLLSFAVFFTFASMLGEDTTHFLSRLALTIILLILTTFSVIFNQTFSFPSLALYWLNEWREKRTTTYETLRIIFWPKYNRSRTFHMVLQIFTWIVIAIVLWAPGHSSMVSSVVLYFFAISILLYLIYYWAMKFLNKDYQHRPWIFYLSFLTLVTSLVCWGIAFYFWSLTAIHWEMSPALARGFNADCVFLDYYDYHDIWHVMSAYAIFTLYLSTLIIDDNLEFQPREDIAVI